MNLIEDYFQKFQDGLSNIINIIKHSRERFYNYMTYTDQVSIGTTSIYDQCNNHGIPFSCTKSIIRYTSFGQTNDALFFNFETFQYLFYWSKL